MITGRMKTSRMLMLNRILVLPIAIASLCASGSIGGSLPWSGETGTAQTKTFPAGEMAKVKGRITRRDIDTLTLSDSTGANVVVLLTETTSVRSNKKGLGVFRRGEDYAVTSLLRGLIVEVEGAGNTKGQIVAEKVRFNESDLKTALTVESRVAPVEEANKKLAGQVEEVAAIAKDAKSEAAKANERISGLDDFDMQSEATIHFAVGSYTLSAADKKALDDIAQKALPAKGYMVEVTGFADSTGDPEKNCPKPTPCRHGGQVSGN